MPTKDIEIGPSGGGLGADFINRPNAAALQVDGSTFEVNVGAATSGTTSNTLLDKGTAQTVTGVKTFTAAPVSIYNTQTVAATGSTASDAAAVTALSPAFIFVTGAEGTKGIILPVAAAGKLIIVKGTGTGILKVWPFTADIINALSASAAISMATNTSAIFLSSGVTQWWTIPLLPS